MRIAIMGTGALGGFFGARLAAAGFDTTFIARGRSLAALKAGGIRVESASLGTIAVDRATATDDPSSVGAVDLVLFAVKAYQIAAAATAMRPLVGARTAVLPVLNGLEIVERIAREIGEAAVLGGMSYVACAMPEPGLVRHFGQDGIVFGEPEGGLSPRVTRIAQVLRKAGIPATPSPDVRREIWTKVLMFCGTGGLCALARQPFGVVRDDPDLRRIFEGALREAEQVARRQGVDLPEDVVPAACRVLDTMAPDGTSSMLRDVVAGRPLEIEVVNGAVVRLARALRVPAPYNEAIYAGLKRLAGGVAS